MTIFEISTLKSSCKKLSCKNKKYLHLGQKMLYFGIFRLEFQKTIVVFEINTFEFF